MAAQVSILFPSFEPDGKQIEYKALSTVTMHDLGIDMLCKSMSKTEKEEKLFESVFKMISDDPRVASYRSDVFEDVINNPQMREEMSQLLEHVQVIKDFGILKRDVGAKAGLWELLHKLDEINDYIHSVESIYNCLDKATITSAGLIALKEYVSEIYKDSYFEELKKDIEGIKMDTSEVQSVTIGINLNTRFEAESIGLVSVNNKQFKTSTILQNFSSAKGVKDGTEWNGDMHYKPIEKGSILPSAKIEKLGGFMAMNSTAFVSADVRKSIVNVPDDDSNSDVPKYLDQVASKMLNLLVKKLKDVLVKYVGLSIGNITNLIPEFAYYIRGAELIEKLQKKGFVFCKAEVADGPECYMEAQGVYNMKLALEGGVASYDDVVTNDLDFNSDNLVYILTGANRGGKTTITQAIGQLFVMAQSGLYVTGTSFIYRPVDGIFTHFPADEDKTMDLGRLGEECTRFKEMYSDATKNSLMLLNETFSTTSFEEGYYIAVDAIKAILNKKIRTIYNTHMHKLGYNVDELNSPDYEGRAVSLVVKSSEEGKRSFKVVKMPPEGMSFAQDIAKKYGVTYEMLIEN
ncbi:MAG: DNA mismatch repair protein [Saccharofermentans sp.]|nr:DNA mismatch repair protein [Saccharofermentans sp.]